MRKKSIAVEKNNNLKGLRLIANSSFQKGALVFKISNYKILNKNTYQTVQINGGKHILELKTLAYMNHSCYPNTFIDITSKSVYAIKEINLGDELTFFYPSTEWQMSRPFNCSCNEKNCIKLVSGAKYLSKAVLAKYKLNKHILDKL